MGVGGDNSWGAKPHNQGNALNFISTIEILTNSISRLLNMKIQQNNICTPLHLSFNVQEDVLGVIATEPKVCSYIDIPLQPFMVRHSKPTQKRLSCDCV